MSRQSVLINCSNLHVGGGVAVASSFIDCLSRISFDDIDVHLLLSSPVQANLVQMNTSFSKFSSCTIKNVFGLSAMWSGVNSTFAKYRVVFSVFGPVYFVRKRARHVIGFAQPNIIYPDNAVVRGLSPIRRISERFKFLVQSLFFSRADCLVVELEHVERGLRRLALFREQAIRIVYSSVHSVFLNENEWSPISGLANRGGIKLGVISRNYPHKNLAVLPAVKQALQKKYGLDVTFYVTFQQDEWSRMDPSFRSLIVNVGGLALNQCPSFYGFLDGVIFPSLLECFSAVPLEAMISRRPLFASDLSFIRDVCGDYCNYFDAENPDDIARSISMYFCKEDSARKSWIQMAYRHALKFPPAEARAEEYLRIIREFVESPNS